MKKGLLIALMLCICGFVNAQRVFTLVYAISDDGFVNIRATPSASGKVVGQVYGMLHGLGNAEKIGQVDGWTKVKKDNVVGYARTKYLECQTWCNGGSPRIVAKKATPHLRRGLQWGKRHWCGRQTLHRASRHHHRRHLQEPRQLLHAHFRARQPLHSQKLRETGAPLAPCL